VRARAASTSAATRREVEQSIARFEKRLDDASDALQTLGKHLGRGAQGSYKEVTATLRTLRRDAGKANKQALKDFDKLRQALTQSKASTTSRATRSSARTNSGTTPSGSRSTSRSTASRSTSSRSSASRSTAKRSPAKRSTAASRAKKS
jgi:DNA-binding protein HU-beta